jgi:hypothetical protein
MATTKKTNSRSRSKSRRSAGKRELLESRNATFYARRKSKGRFSEMDERGRSLATDRRRRAKHSAKRGEGDRGDRRQAA